VVCVEQVKIPGRERLDFVEREAVSKPDNDAIVVSNPRVDVLELPLAFEHVEH
jgi:hypothetical protein